MLKAELVIPQMFSAYAESIEYLSNGLHHYQYFCEECKLIFSVAWGKIPGSMSWYELGKYITCPNCGMHHEKYVAYIKRNELVPYKLRLAVKEYKEFVALEVTGDASYFSDYLHFKARKYKETFRFNVFTQTVTFTSTDGETMELGSPFKLDLLDGKKSILRFFKLNCLANAEHKSELNNILKVLRETVQNKLDKRIGHKVPSMFINCGSYCGIFLLPILNIAYRVACPDAPNLPAVYREDKARIETFWRDRMINDFDYFNSVMEQTRNKKDFVTALINAQELPNKPAVRRILTDDPFRVKLLAEAFPLCKNYDCAINLYQALLDFPKDYSSTYLNEELFQFLHKMRPLYGEDGVIRLVAEAQELKTKDCANLYSQLIAENKKAIKTEGIKLRDLHDWMALRHKIQTHTNIKFDVPEHIIKRLSMQTDRLKFFLPKESLELLTAGHELHNCVASYGKNMKDNNLWIVLVADDKGKLAACLEINNKELVQAEIGRNKKVSSDPELNAAIFAWAKATGIKIKTSDVKLPAKKGTKIAIPA